MKFGENLKKLRKFKKLSQENLAEKMHVSRQSISKWETGEAYPEMNNILQLCKVFHCSISDLVNDNIVDINLLNDDTKIGVIKLKKEQQLKVKILSKSIAIISKIGKVFTTIFILFIIFFMILFGLIINKINVVNNQIINENSNNTIKVTESNNELSISILKMKVANITNPNDIEKVKEILHSNSRLVKIGYIETALLFITIGLVFIYIILSLLEKLFNNIYNGDTPFTLENVGYIKKISYVMIIITIISNIINVILEHLLKMHLNSNIALFSIVQILFMFSISYIFQYGYEIQLDSKGKIYEDKI